MVDKPLNAPFMDVKGCIQRRSYLTKRVKTRARGELLPVRVDMQPPTMTLPEPIMHIM